MTQFTIRAANAAGNIKTFLYDNQTSELTDEFGKSVVSEVDPSDNPYWSKKAKQFDASKPVAKTSNIKRLKIQLGLSCNYECDYCSQRFVPRAEETNKNDVQPFLDRMPEWFDGGEDGKGKGVWIEFWGGEPFVYWKTFKPLAEALRERYPHAEFLTITNGSLLDLEKNEWLDRMGFAIAVSHDGPGQHVRGPDPFEDPVQCEAILDLFNRLHPQGRFSFNAMTSRQNISRGAVKDFFIKLTGRDDVQIGEGNFIDPYDADGLNNSLQSADEINAFTSLALKEIISGYATFENNQIVANKVEDFIKSLEFKRPASVLTQKCGMDREDYLSVDLKGRVVTCQNVSAASAAPNGQSHHIGDVTDLSAVKLTTSRHWSTRAGCSACPVLQLCKGSCMFLEGELWDSACANSFSDNIVFFAVAFEILTGYRPFLIDGGRADRREIWNVKTQPRRKVIPIMAV